MMSIAALYRPGRYALSPSLLALGLLVLLFGGPAATAASDQHMETMEGNIERVMARTASRRVTRSCSYRSRRGFALSADFDLGLEGALIERFDGASKHRFLAFETMIDGLPLTSAFRATSSMDARRNLNRAKTSMAASKIRPRVLIPRRATEMRPWLGTWRGSAG